MCVVKTPKIPDPATNGSDKPLPILRNPILDGLLGNIAATRAGTSAFRIDLLNPLKIPGGGNRGGSGSGSGGGSSGGGSSGGVGGVGGSSGGSSGGSAGGSGGSGGAGGAITGGGGIAKS